MSENIYNYNPGYYTKRLTAVRKAALSTINGDPNSRRPFLTKTANILTQKNGKVTINPYLPEAQKFKIFEDIDDENKGNVAKPKTAAAKKCEKENTIKNENRENVLKKRSVEDVSKDKEIITACNDLAASLNESCDFTSSPKGAESTPDIQNVDSVRSHSEKKDESKETDLVWFTPYRQDIYDYFREREKKAHPNPKYIEKQQDMNMKMRAILIDWCVEVADEYNLHPETLYLSVSYVDRFLSHVSVSRGKLQLVGTASLFIASKSEEIYPPELKDFVYITDNTYSKQQILKMEHLILKVLNFDLSPPTAFTFLQLYLSMCNPPTAVKQMSEYICEISLLYDTFLNHLPSVIAAGSLALSSYVTECDVWNKAMEEMIGYKLTDLSHICELLFDKLHYMPSSAENATYKKYKSSKYGSVSLIPYPDRLVISHPFSCSCPYC